MSFKRRIAMSVQERIRIIRLIEKMNANKEYSRKLGLTDLSFYTFDQKSMTTGIPSSVKQMGCMPL